MNENKTKNLFSKNEKGQKWNIIGATFYHVLKTKLAGKN
jgi:hypothetical protein